MNVDYAVQLSLFLIKDNYRPIFFVLFLSELPDHYDLAQELAIA